MESSGPSDLVQSPSIQPNRTSSWKDYINLFQRPPWIQIIFLICWFCGFTLIIYYLTYEGLIIDLVRQGILPENLEYFLIISGGLFISSTLFLILTRKR
jgi:hypothetical protein